jgi:hypothetical protein
MDELDIVLKNHVQGNVYSLESVLDAETGAQTLRFTKSTALPDEVPLIIGDVIHNLHAALDTAMWAITPESHRARAIKFPFYELQSELTGQLTKGQMKDVYAPEIVRLIIDDIKPYRGGNDRLYGLHDLDIVDKHQLLISVIDGVHLGGVSGTMGGNPFTNLNFFINGLGQINAIKGLGVVKIRNYGKASFHLRFAEGEIFKGKDFIPTVNELVALVSSAVDAIDRVTNNATSPYAAPICTSEG